jgi:hypothetical protein
MRDEHQHRLIICPTCGARPMRACVHPVTRRAVPTHRDRAALSDLPEGDRLRWLY